MECKWEYLTSRSKAFPVTLFLMLFFCLPVSSVFAQTASSDSITVIKLQTLKQSLQLDHQHVQRWWYGWLGLYSAATIGQGVVCLSSDNKSLRQDMLLGAATTILGAAGQFISPFRPNSEFKIFSSLPETEQYDQHLKLAAAEKLLNQWSERERMALTWQNHILPTAVNVAGGLITWLAFEDNYGKKRTIWDGIVNFAINTVVTEAQIWTQPTLAKRHYKKYCLRYLNGDDTYSCQPEVNVYLEAMPGGIGLKITF